MDHPVDIRCVVRGNQRHVAVDTLLRFFGVVERQRPLMGNTAHLPLIVVVKATKPAEIVDRHIEMHLVTGGTELRRILTVERLKETLFMGFRVQSNQVIVEFADCGVFARCHFVQWRVLDDISAVAHRILNPLH